MYRLVAALVLLLLQKPACADAIGFSPTTEKAGWRILAMPGVTPAKFSVDADGTLIVVANAAVGWMWRPVRGRTSDATRAQWNWRTDEAVGPTDLTRRGADDRALAVYFIFNDAAIDAGNPLALITTGSARALVYVSGGNRPRGEVVSSPHMKERGKFIVLRPGDTPHGQWHDEHVDLSSDYTRVFGGKRPPLVAIAISSDSDDTGGRNSVRFRHLELSQ
jgi:Protein of unknown function (DUF3047)